MIDDIELILYCYKNLHITICAGWLLQLNTKLESAGERKYSMAELEGKKLPSVEQVETIIAEYGTSSIDAIAERFQLEQVVVQATIDCLRRLRRVSGDAGIPAIACYRDDKLESIVRCAGSKHGYV